MGRELGRISGPLLSENLLRNGIDLAFDNTSLYLNVNDRFVGFGTSTPVRTLEINGYALTNNLVVDTQWDIGTTLEFNSNNILNYNGVITISPNQSSSPLIVVPGVKTDNIQFKNNNLTGLSDSSINLSPSGIGQTVFGSGIANSPISVLVDGDLHTTGNVTFDGNITFGNNANDLINIISKINTPITPNQDIQFDLGASDKYFRTTYVNSYNSTTLTGKQLQPVDTVNYPFTTGLTIRDSTFNIPNSDMAISSQNGTGKLQFVTDLVINGGFETGDFTGWSQFGNLSYTTVEKDNGGFDTTFLGGSNSHFGFGPYISNNGTILNSSVYQSGDAYPSSGLTTYAVNTGDRVMFSMIITASTDDDNTGIGIGTHNTILEKMLGANSSSFGITANGHIYRGNLTFTTGAPTFTNGDIVDVAVDRQNNKLWLRVNNGYWNNSPTAKPETVVGGYDISYITGTVYPGAIIGYTGGFSSGNGSAITLNLSISYIVPGGYDFALIYPSAAHGGVYFEKAGPIDTGGAITQTIITYPGATYTVSWWVKVAAASTPNSVAIQFNGEILEIINNTVAKDFFYREYTRVATGFTADITVAYQNNPSYFYIDDISVTTKIPYFTGNRINNVTNGPLTLATSPRGYVKFDTTTGMVLPVGNNTNKMVPPVLGATRYNTDQSYAEVYNGSNWQNIAGMGGYAAPNEVQNIINVWSIILG